MINLTDKQSKELTDAIVDAVIRFSKTKEMTAAEVEALAAIIEALGIN